VAGPVIRYLLCLRDGCGRGNAICACHVAIVCNMCCTLREMASVLRPRSHHSRRDSTRPHDTWHTHSPKPSDCNFAVSQSVITIASGLIVIFCTLHNHRGIPKRSQTPAMHGLFPPRTPYLTDTLEPCSRLSNRNALECGERSMLR
jgi:hypothetical protein